MVVFTDSDVFPIKNIEEVSDEVKDQHCDLAKVTLEDFAEPKKEGLCDYILAGVRDFGGGVNGGFVVLKPNRAMHKRLLREFGKVDQYDNSQAGQSFFRWFWAKGGAFPAQMLPRGYNAYFPNAEDEGRVSIVHEKLWVAHNDTAPWLKDIIRDGWTEMVDFFNSDEFARAREADGKPGPRKPELSLAISW